MPARRPSPAVYRRRRAVALGGAILVVVFVVALIVLLRPGSSRGESATTPATSSTPTAKAGSAAPASTSIPTATATSAPDGSPCTAATVDVEAVVSATSFAAGQQPQLSLSLTNTGRHTCVIDAGTAAQVYTITSGSETYWTSTDCQTGATSTKIILKPGKTLSSTPIPWDRTRSAKDTCEATRPVVPAAGASYHLGVSVDGIASKRTRQFLLG